MNSDAINKIVRTVRKFIDAKFTGSLTIHFYQGSVITKQADRKEKISL